MEEDKLVCFTKDELLKPREIIIEIMDFMVKAGLTDYTGGNMALRIGTKIYSTQTKASINYRWRIRPDDIIVTDVDQNVLEGRKEKLSSEADLHHGILKRFPKINCTLHGNTHYSPLIVSQGIAPIGITEVAKEFNIIKSAVVPMEYPMFSEEEKNFIYDSFSEMDRNGEALTVIMHNHGSLVAAEDHNKAFVLFDALEANAKYIFDKEILKSSKLVSSVFEKINNTKTGSEVIDKNEVFRADIKDKVITAEDIEYINKQSSCSKVFISNTCTLTSLAENRAKELGLEIVRE